MTALQIGGAGWVVIGFAVAGVLLLPLAQSTRLGVLHPVLAWLALEGIFFGIGSIDLAIVDGKPGPALYLGGVVLAVAVGARLSHRIGANSARVAHGRGGPPDPPPQPLAERGARRIAPGLLAAAALATILPSILATGLPLLSADPTLARAGLAGVQVQLMRVALPGLVVVLLLEQASLWRPSRRLIITSFLLGTVVILEILLASRYLVLELLAALVLAWWLAGRTIPVRAGIVVGLVGLLAFVLIGVIRAPQDFATAPVRTALERTVSRVFLVQPRTLDALQTAIPAERTYFLGATWFRRLGPLLGREDIPNLGYWIYPRVVSGEQEVAGYAAPGLIGEAWANFGPAGLALFVAVGVCLERLGVLLAWRRARVVDLAAAALLILFVARTNALGLLGLGLLVGLVVVWRMLAGDLGGLARDAGDALRWRDPEPRGEASADAGASPHRTVVPPGNGESADGVALESG